MNCPADLECNQEIQNLVNGTDAPGEKISHKPCPVARGSIRRRWQMEDGKWKMECSSPYPISLIRRRWRRDSLNCTMSVISSLNWQEPLDEAS